MSARAIALAVLAVTSAGCVSLGGDVARVRDLTGAAELPELPADDVDPSTPPEARALLGKPLDADTAVRLALVDNRELRATLREIGVARGRLVQAWEPPNPRLDVELTPEFETNLELRAEYDVTRLVLVPFRARAAAPDVDASRFRAASAVIDTGYRARVAFYRARAAQQKVAIAHQALEALAASREAAKALLDSGNATPVDYADQDAAYEQGRADTAELELDAERAHEELVRVLGLHGPDASFTLAGVLPSVPEADEPGDGVESRAVRASFDLKQRRARVESLARRAGYAHLEGWLPDVAADVHALQPRDAATGGVPPNVPWLVTGGLHLTVPIFDHNEGSASALASEAGAEAERYYGAAVELRSRARELYARLETAHGRARLYEKTIVPARRRVVEQSLLQYNAMHIGVFQLLTARREELRAAMAEVDARADYWIARAAFDALMLGHAPSTRSP